MFTKIKSSLCLVGEQVEEIASKYLHLVPDSYKENRIKRDGPAHHITIHFGYDSQDNPENKNIYPMGFGCDKNKEVYYVVIYYPAGEKVSKQYFHITLGFKTVDLHDFNKNISTIIEYENMESVVKNLINDPSTDLDRQYEIYNHIYNLNIDESLKKPVVYNLAKICGKKKNYKKVEELGYLLKELDIISGSFILVKLFSFSGTNYDTIIDLILSTNDELDAPNYMRDDEINFLLDIINKYQDKKYYFMKENKITKLKLPMNFSNIFDNIFGSGDPENYNQVLDIMNIRQILSLTEIKNKLTTMHFPIVDREPPTIEQMVSIIKYMEPVTAPLLVHCLGGVGRTNTVISCYLMYKKKLSHTDAMAMVRSRRKKMILSQSQINFTKTFNDYLIKNNYLEELNCLQIADCKISKNKNLLPKLVVMCGYPCSGKSTLSQFLVENIENCIRLNQDELGQKKCIDEANKNIKNTKTVIIDKTNLTKKERHNWIEMFFNPKSLCIFMDYSIEECVERFRSRKDHKLASSEHIFEGLRNKLERPDMSEKFNDVIVIKNDDDINLLLTKFKIKAKYLDNTTDEPFIIKFPRTKHFLNLGSASRDDLIMTQNETDKFLNKIVYVEEKIDGGNLGIRIKNGKFVCQNRSHYVTSQSHSQFKELDKWIYKHESELMAILCDDCGNNPFILFGEWVFAKHSINYTNLPDSKNIKSLSDFIFFGLEKVKSIESILFSRTILLHSIFLICRKISLCQGNIWKIN